MRWREFLRRIGCLLAWCNSYIVVGNYQLDEKPPENDHGGATEEVILLSQKRSCFCWKIQAAPRSKETWLKYINRRCRTVVEVSVRIYFI